MLRQRKRQANLWFLRHQRNQHTPTTYTETILSGTNPDTVTGVNYSTTNFKNAPKPLAGLNGEV